MDDITLRINPGKLEQWFSNEMGLRGFKIATSTRVASKENVETALWRFINSRQSKDCRRLLSMRNSFQENAPYLDPRKDHEHIEVTLYVSYDATRDTRELLVAVAKQVDEAFA